MKKALLLIIGIVMLGVLMINCDRDNPVTINPPPVDTSNINWPKMVIIRNDTAIMEDAFGWKIVIDDPNKIDSIVVRDSSILSNGWGASYYRQVYSKEDMKDTMLAVYSQIGDDNARFGQIISMYKNGVKKDTIDFVIVIDNVPVKVVKGTFYPQILNVGEKLHLWVKVVSNSTPYVCQWYKDGTPIGSEFIRQSDDSIFYDIDNVQITDSGEYSITLKKPHITDTESGMFVTVKE